MYFVNLYQLNVDQTLNWSRFSMEMNMRYMTSITSLPTLEGILDCYLVEVFLDFWTFSGIWSKLGSKKWSKSVENEFLLIDVVIHLLKGAFTYDVRCFGVIFDLPTYPNQISSDVAWPTYLPQDLTSDFENFTYPINVYNMYLLLLLM